MLRGQLFAVLVALVLALPTPTVTLAQASCLQDIEPNDTPEAAQQSSDAICVEGTLPGGDQDLALWEVLPRDATTRWTISVDGLAGLLTALKLFVITSDPGAAVLSVEQSHVLEIARQPQDGQPAVLENVLLPTGRYLLGISRSALSGAEGDAAPGYRYRIERGSALPQNEDVEPNDDPAQGAAITDESSLAGDLDGSADYYAWQVSATDEHWAIELQVPLGEQATLELLDRDGTVIDAVHSESTATSLDLELAPGTYSIGISPRAYEPTPYVLTTSRAPAEGDPEPNDTTADAILIEDGEPVLGRLAGSGDRDRFVLEVPLGEPALRDVRVIWQSALDRTLCLIDSDDEDVVCERGTGGVALTELGLPAGQNVFEVRGPDDADHPYLMRIDKTSAQFADFEAEPNDTVAFATDIDPDLDMRGHGGDKETDIFRLHVEDEPQLWQVDLSGTPGSRLEWIEASGRALGRGETAAGDVIARLTDLYLVPGDHWFRVSGAEGTYSMEVTPLGPPLPDGEREPNGETVRAERYRIGSRRTGRLAVTPDVDFYRFSLAAAQHIALRLQQPADARTRLILHNGMETIGDLRGHPAGQPLDYDLWLQPGDYLIELRPEQVSEGTYELRSERLDPFSLAIDQEPNDGPTWARDVPASLLWEGDAVDTNDEDWYRLPPLMSSEALRIAVDDERARVRLVSPDGPLILDREDDGTLVATAAPLQTPLHVAISADGPYRVQLSGAGLVPHRGPSQPLPVELAWALEEDTVAAYWPEWQRIEAVVHVANQGPDELDLTLGTTSSHYLWEAALDSASISLRAGESRSVPVLIEVGADAWAGEPVQLAVRASSADGSQASAVVDVSAEPDASPVSPHIGWHVPEELLGGLNIASAGLGAVPGGTVDANFEPQLFDGVTPEGGGFGSLIRSLPIELTVDLAGSEPMPVAGMILNPQARDGRLSEVPQDFELMLSVDGVDWRPALRGTLSPLPVDQPFVLEEPVEATHAMLRITSVHADGPGYVALGEWKVVAVPGTPAPGGPLDIADLTVGGHMVRMTPAGLGRDLGDSLFDADDERESIHLEDDPTFDLVVGFHDGRAAQITALEWVDPRGSDPSDRLETVDVSVSRRGPFGPWESLGGWSLSRAAGGDVAPFVLDDPAWVRYLRLSSRAPVEARELELPATLRVIERRTDDEYRSILGEWGYTSAAGPLEWRTLEEPRDVLTRASADAGDRLEEAATLHSGITVADRAEIDVDEDWYSIDVPADHNTLELVVQGQPSVRVSLELFDESGKQRPLAFAAQPDGSITYQAAVEPSQRYGLRIHQPPVSAVFTFDTSGSMGPFLDIVTEGMRSFAADVQPGREAVTIVPFEEAPLLPEWEDDAYVLQDAVNRHGFEGGSSGAEAGLISSSDLLMEREGARAVLLVTDAETSTHQRSSELWERLERVRPIIFSVHVGAQTRAVEARHLMQDWAASGGGHYVYPTTHGEMDRAFDRMATWLRRPADYSVSYTTTTLAPSSLAVRAATGAGASSLAPGVAVEIILDTSGSMNKKLAGRPRIDIARDSLETLIGEPLADGVPVAVRVFGGKGKKNKARCQTRLVQPLQPLDRGTMLDLIGELGAGRKTKTPIAAALKAVATDLAAVTGPRSVVLVTDGNETCKGDPAAAIEELRAAGIDITLNIVGFALEDEELKSQMAAWAEAGDGSYFDASGAEDLEASLALALSAPFRVYGPDGEVYEGGTVGGDPIGIDPGTYRVEVLTDPVVEFEEVVVGGGESVSLELPLAE